MKVDVTEAKVKKKWGYDHWEAIGEINGQPFKITKFMKGSQSKGTLKLNDNYAMYDNLEEMVHDSSISRKNRKILKTLNKKYDTDFKSIYDIAIGGHKK